MEAQLQIEAVPPAPPPLANGRGDVDVPLTYSAGEPPRSSECIPIAIAALHPLIFILALLYFFPGLFSDVTAHTLVAPCQLDELIDNHSI
ncbi:hypothetical protein ACLMJK_001039 [Lecanora helva]